MIRVALLLVIVSLASACAPKPREAPPSAAERVEPTVAGLLRLFQQECLDQRNLSWARDESDRRAYYYCRAFPNSLFMKEGKIGDCESEIGGSVDWTTSTNQGEDLQLYLSWFDWDWPRDRHAACGVEVPEHLGPALQQAANAVAEGSFRSTPQPIHYSFGEDEYWQWSLTPPRLELNHLRSQQSWSLRIMVHPDFPEHYNFVRDHIMRECPLNPETSVYECTSYTDRQ